METLSIKEIQQYQLELMTLVDNVCRKNNIHYYLISGSCLGAIRHKGFIPWDDDIDIGMFREDYEHFLRIFNSSFDQKKYFLQNEKTEKLFIPSLSRICILGTKLEMPWIEHLKINKSIFMDIFPLDNVPDKEKDRKKQYQQLKFINKLLTYKIYTLSGNKYKDILKHIISSILKLIPLNYLKIKRENIITKFSKEKTMCVCSMGSKYGYKKHIMPRTVYGEAIELDFENHKFFFPQNYKYHLQHLFGDNYMNIPPTNKRDKMTKAYRI